MNTSSPIVSVPLRDDVAVFAAALIDTDPVPVRLAPDVMVSHDTAVDAVQAQLLDVVTVALAVPPPAATEAVEGESE